MLKLNSAMQRIFKSNILKKPEASIQTDEALEFQGDFAKYCHSSLTLQLSDNSVQSMLHAIPKFICRFPTCPPHHMPASV